DRVWSGGFKLAREQNVLREIGARVCEQHLSEVGGGSGVATAPCRRKSQCPTRLDALDVDRLAALDHREGPRLRGIPAETFPERKCLVPKVKPLGDEPSQLKQAPT